MVEAATHACIDCNAAIKRVSSINTDLSGSTGIMAYLHGNGTTLTVINVGDSRCILGEKAPPPGLAVLWALFSSLSVSSVLSCPFLLVSVSSLRRIQVF